MNKKLLLIALIAIIPCYIQLIAKDSNRIANDNNQNSFKNINLLGKYNFFRKFCDYTYSSVQSECNKLNTAYENAKTHNKYSRQIKNLNEKIKTIETANSKLDCNSLNLKDILCQSTLEKQRDQLVKLCPEYKEEYLKNLTVDQKEELQSTISSLMNKIFEEYHETVYLEDLNEMENLFYSIGFNTYNQ